MEKCIGNLDCKSLKKDPNNNINRKTKVLVKNGN